MRTLVTASSAVALAFCACVLQLPAAQTGVQLNKLTDRVRVEIDGKLFTEYYYSNVPRPFLYPIIGPGEVGMTRNYPMKDVADEDRDHKHHRGLWYSHGAVNGHDFWSEEAKAGKIVHDKFLLLESGPQEAALRTRNNWVSNDGKTICSDERTLRIHRPGQGSDRLLDFEITLIAGDSDVVFGDTKEGTMGIRLAETMRLKGKVGKGHIVNSTGKKDGETWGKRATWCAYSGPADDKLVGVAIFDHPGNPRHPTWWHVRDYGLFAANPFGQHDFEKLSDKSAGDLKIPAGKSVTFRYRFLFHEGDSASANLPQKYQEYAATGRK